jgi:hypothetical protein
MTPKHAYKVVLTETVLPFLCAKPTKTNKLKNLNLNVLFDICLKFHVFYVDVLLPLPIFASVPPCFRMVVAAQPSWPSKTLV